MGTGDAVMEHVPDAGMTTGAGHRRGQQGRQG
jgi:hypothetical protein